MISGNFTTYVSRNTSLILKIKLKSELINYVSYNFKVFKNLKDISFKEYIPKHMQC